MSTFSMTFPAVYRWFRQK